MSPLMIVVSSFYHFRQTQWKSDTAKRLLINLNYDKVTIFVRKFQLGGYLSRDMTNQKNDCAPSEDLDQPGHPPSAQWVAKDPTFLHADGEDWSGWADAQADLSLGWAHAHFVCFVMRRLILFPIFLIRYRSHGPLPNLISSLSKTLIAWTMIYSCVGV